MFVFAVEDGAFKGLLELIDRGLGDVARDLFGVFRPELLAQVRDAGEGVSEVGWLDALESFPPVLEGWIQPCVSSAETSHPD